jgi:hypothetical protein
MLLLAVQALLQAPQLAVLPPCFCWLLPLRRLHSQAGLH